MKKKLIYTSFFSLLGLMVSAQDKKVEEKEKWKYEPNFMVGVDVLNTGVSFFSDRQLFQGFISSKIKGNIHGIV